MDEDERGDAFQGIPKLRLFGCPWILPWGALGIPKLRLLPLLFHNPSNLYPKTGKLHNTKLNRKSHELR